MYQFTESVLTINSIELEDAGTTPTQLAMAMEQKVLILNLQ